jgi:hypothetical protein
MSSAMGCSGPQRLGSVFSKWMNGRRSWKTVWREFFLCDLCVFARNREKSGVVDPALFSVNVSHFAESSPARRAQRPQPRSLPHLRRKRAQNVFVATKNRPAYLPQFQRLRSKEVSEKSPVQTNFSSHLGGRRVAAAWRFTPSDKISSHAFSSS